MRGKGSRASEEAIARFNARVRVRYAQLREQISALRPNWDKTKLEEIKHGYRYGTKGGEPGLEDILDMIQKADALDAKFRK